ncbi:glycoside hydrolase family 47 protein [Xylariales sp. PMI_506]|nr:glycoside hydrolase family 47 protein [Xylariales sp. PMI_506]
MLVDLHLGKHQHDNPIVNLPTKMAFRRRAQPAVLAVFVIIVLLLFSTSRKSPLTAVPFTSKELKFEQSSYDWSNTKQYFPVASLAPLPQGGPHQLPKVQHQPITIPPHSQQDKINQQRRQSVRDTFVRCWKAYREHAWLHDELKPLSGGQKDPFGGWGATLVDSLDSLWIMDLKQEFFEAASAAVKLDWANTSETGVNLFETTIRHLGGLLSAYDLSREPALLSKAIELGDMLLMAFDTPNRMPGFWLNFEDAKQGRQLAGTHDPSAGPTSLGLEFTRLAMITGENKYYDAVTRVAKFLEDSQEQSLLPGMWPAMIDFRTQQVIGDDSFTLGALADSLYEYIPKMFVLLGGREAPVSYENMYRRTMEVVINNLLFRPMLPNGEDILFAGTAFARDDGIQLVPEGQHLSCFTGGMFALGGQIFQIQEHVNIGERLARGCAWAYQAFPTGVMPEIFALLECNTLQGCEWDDERWRKEGDQNLKPGFRHARDPRYILRPEAIESLFILYRITGSEDLRELAWEMFQNITEATETDLANSAIKDVTTRGKTEKEDSMESFWLAETLKYFYLIFSPPDYISLDEFVFNTEAHPLRRV